MIKNKGFSLLNSDDHPTLLKRMNQDPVNARPDICHQVFFFGFVVRVEFACCSRESIE